jgi:hypothetical protein
METHELLAFVTLGIFGVLALWRVLRERRMGAGERALALGATLAGAGVLIATSVYGGRLVFEHAAGIPTDVLTAETRSRAEGHHHAAGEEHGEEQGDDGHSHDTTTAPAAAADSSGGEPEDHPHPPGTPAHEH